MQRHSSRVVEFTALSCALLALFLMPQADVLAQCQDATGAPAPCPEREKKPAPPPAPTAMPTPTSPPGPVASPSATGSARVTPLVPPLAAETPSGSTGGAEDGAQPCEGCDIDLTSPDGTAHSDQFPSPWFFAAGGCLIGLLVGAGVVGGLATPAVRRWLTPVSKDATLPDDEQSGADGGSGDPLPLNPEEMSIDKHNAWPRKTATREGERKTRKPDPD